MFNGFFFQPEVKKMAKIVFKAEKILNNLMCYHDILNEKRTVFVFKRNKRTSILP